MGRQQRRHVLDVLLGDLVDLQLGQQQVRRLGGRPGPAQPPLELDRVRHPQRVQEHVDLGRGLASQVDLPVDPVFLAERHRRVGLIPQPGEHPPELALLLPVRVEVEIPRRLPAQRDDAIPAPRAVPEHPRGPGQLQHQPAPARLGQQSIRLAQQRFGVLPSRTLRS